MIREACPDDAASIDQFLAAHAETSMFLRGNLAAHGTQEKEHRHGTRFHLAEQDGAICAVAGVTNGGYLMCQSSDVTDAFYARFASTLKGRTLAGMTGAPKEIKGVFDALGCQGAAFSIRAQEPLYALQLSDFQVVPYNDVALRRPSMADIEYLSTWFEGFNADTGLMPLGDGGGRDTAQHFIENPDARVMIVEGQPVAMTTFNARAHEIVQIGGVYVPPSLRGRGYGGGIVARHLTEVLTEGIERAILFAASDHAARAYEAIGFSHIGSYELALFKDPWRVPL